jgi:hypothetical protein
MLNATVRFPGFFDLFARSHLSAHGELLVANCLELVKVGTAPLAATRVGLCSTVQPDGYLAHGKRLTKALVRIISMGVSFA